jgi:parvulin-like peptidyl-prolyl isomerase
VARDFGGDFAAAVMKVPAGEWHGPVRSAVGAHIVLIDERIPARTPPLAEVRAAVEREWLRERQVKASEALYQQLRARYTVAPDPATLAAQP